MSDDVRDAPLGWLEWTWRWARQIVEAPPGAFVGVNGGKVATMRAEAERLEPVLRSELAYRMLIVDGLPVDGHG